MEETQPGNQMGREALANFEKDIEDNVYTMDADYIHSIKYFFPENFSEINAELDTFGAVVAQQIEPLVRENNLALNLPRLDAYNAVGTRIDKVTHHPAYIEVGNLIYQTGLLGLMAQPGGLLRCLSILFLSAQAGEAGHNCPIACSAGMIRVLSKMEDFPGRTEYLEKLTLPAYPSNYTGAQFLTEIQGGSDVGLNAVSATQDENNIWRISGEKWFCSNAGADLIFLTARFDESLSGTKGLGLFLVPAKWNGQKNAYTIRRLKDKIGTRSMATGEIDFHGAYAIAMQPVEEGIHLVMDNVLHLSRLFNAFCVLGMARRAYHLARAYAERRVMFAHPIIHYPLVKENLARMKAENTAMLAGVFATTRLQDQFDLGMAQEKDTKLLLRLLVNMQKYFTAYLSVQHIHHALDVLAGNGTIETFSPLPRLLRDCIVCENWEGTHNVLRMQILKDILKFDLDKIFLVFMENKLIALKSYSLHTEDITRGVRELSDDIVTFRMLEPEIQTLQIRLLVDKMVALYCALMLLQEALEQQKTQHSSTKLDCFYYFSMLHVEKSQTTYDQTHLELLTRIIS